MNISRDMVYAQKVEEESSKRKSRYAKWARSFYSGSSKGRLDIQDKPRFRKRVYNHFPTNTLKLVMIGCLTPSLKTEEVLAHLTRR